MRRGEHGRASQATRTAALLCSSTPSLHPPPPAFQQLRTCSRVSIQVSRLMEGRPVAAAWCIGSRKSAGAVSTQSFQPCPPAHRVHPRRASAGAYHHDGQQHGGAGAGAGATRAKHNGRAAAPAGGGGGPHPWRTWARLECLHLEPSAPAAGGASRDPCEQRAGARCERGAAAHPGPPPLERRCPRAPHTHRRAAISPVLSAVLPTPEAVPASTMQGAPRPWREPAIAGLMWAASNTSPGARREVAVERGAAEFTGDLRRAWGQVGASDRERRAPLAGPMLHAARRAAAALAWAALAAAPRLPAAAGSPRAALPCPCATSHRNMDSLHTMARPAAGIGGLLNTK